MATDLKLVGLKYNIAAAVFFASICPTQEMLGLGRLTHNPPDTLQPCGSAIVRIFLKNANMTSPKLDFPEILLLSFTGRHDGVGLVITTRVFGMIHLTPSPSSEHYGRMGPGHDTDVSSE